MITTPLASLRSFVRTLRPRTVHHKGAVLPARHMRTGGSYFQRDEDFLASAQKEVHRLQTHCGLTQQSNVLDIGCGPCRLPIGILHELGEIDFYCGVDVNPAYTQWGKKYISRSHPNFRFHHIDVHNARYNKQGHLTQSQTALPFEDHTFDIIYLYSVFSHLLEEDVIAYLREFKRLLASSGRIFLTAFVEENVPAIEENPENAHREWKGPLNCVQYERTHFENLLREHGFSIDNFVYGEETDKQSAYSLSLAS